jgi:hypothetical protein
LACASAGGFQLPSPAGRIDGASVFGQYSRMTRQIGPSGAGSQFDSLSLPGGRERRSDGWAPLAVAVGDATTFPGWWRRDGLFVLTIAAAVPMDPPSRLQGGGDLATATPTDSWLERPLV